MKLIITWRKTINKLNAISKVTIYFGKIKLQWVRLMERTQRRPRDLQQGSVTAFYFSAFQAGPVRLKEALSHNAGLHVTMQNVFIRLLKSGAVNCR